MKIEKTSDFITPSLTRLQKRLEAVPQGAYKEFVRNTPKATGNARSKTRLRTDTIIADYPYAKRLDKGYSRQAPKGMTEPMLAWLKNTLRQILRK